MMSKVSTNKLKALSRIESKIVLLDSWAATGVPDRPDGSGKEFYPKSVRQFNFWDLTENSICVRERNPNCARSANDTLNQYPHLRAQIETLIVAIRQREQGGVTKLEKIKALKERLTIHQEYSSVLERQLVILRLQSSDQETALRSEISRLQNILVEEKSLFSLLKKENGNLKRKVSELTATLKKVAPLRDVSDE